MTPQRVALAAAGAAWESATVQDLEADPGVTLTRRCVDIAELIAHAQARGTEVAVVDASLPGLDVDAVRALRTAGVLVLGIGDRERAVSFGIDAVTGPEAVLAALGDLAQAQQPVSPASSDVHDTVTARGRVVTVWGPTGAPGRSTVAMALADAFAHAGSRTVLIDADVFGGAQAQLLGLLDEVSGLMAACRAANQGRTDELLETVQSLGSRFDVLTGIPRADMWVHLRRAPLERVIEHAVDHYDVVVVDVGFCLEPGEGAAAGRHQATRSLLEAADVVVAVGRADPTGLTRIVRGMSELDELGIERPAVVLNQVRDRIGWSDDELVATMERLVGVRPVALLPSDPATVDLAALRGATPRETSGSSPFVRRVADLAARLVATPVLR